MPLSFEKKACRSVGEEYQLGFCQEIREIEIKLDKNYLLYEPIYQLYYALSNVALWDKSYIKETKRLLKKLRL